MSARKSILALLLAATTVLGVVGCGRGEGHGETEPKAPDAAHSGAAGSSSAGSGAARDVKDSPNKPSGGVDDSQIPLVTPENAGNPVVEVKVGDPVRVSKNGLTLTVAVPSIEKLPGYPPDKSDTIAGTDCGVWWKISEKIEIDAEPHASWDQWYADIGVILAFEEGKDSRNKYSTITVGDTGTGSDRLINQTLPAEAERKKNVDNPFHKEFLTKQYFGMCTDFDSGIPSDHGPLGAVFRVSNFGNESPQARPLVRWFR